MDRFTGWIRFILLITLSLGSSRHLEAQQPAISFSNIGARNGMSSNWVTSLCQDADGLMWIGTNREIYRVQTPHE
jgi:ligand-binding sensor domain-containing protein